MPVPELAVPAPPAPEPEPEPDIAPAAEEPEPEVAEVEEPEPEPQRRDPEPDPEPATPAPPQRSPNPGEIRQGLELARKRRPMELPMPRRSSRLRTQPKLELEDPTASSPGRKGPMQLGSITLNAPPGQMIEGAIQNLQSGEGVRQAVGDGYGTGGLGGYMPPSEGNTGSALELLSDPRGVDFRPYLIQVLATVRRNWYAVIPESARLGISRGLVTIQFAIVRDGVVSKLVIAGSSGVSPLDRAAVAGISASNPFPPLPANYGGKDVRLQFEFRYNIQKK